MSGEIQVAKCTVGLGPHLEPVTKLPEIRRDHLSVLLFCRFTKWAPDSTGMNPLNFPEADLNEAASRQTLSRARCQRWV
jgi:hypothetical protein